MILAASKLWGSSWYQYLQLEMKGMWLISEGKSMEYY